MSWNFRVVRFTRPGGACSFAIHEAFYDTDVADQVEFDTRKRPSSISPESYEPMGLSSAELRREIERMLTAFDNEIVDGETYAIRVPYERKREKAEDINRQVKDLEREVREWRKAFVKSNTDRGALERQLNELRRSLSSKVTGT